MISRSKPFTHEAQFCVNFCGQSSQRSYGMLKSLDEVIRGYSNLNYSPVQIASFLISPNDLIQKLQIPWSSYCVYDVMSKINRIIHWVRGHNYLLSVYQQKPSSDEVTW